MYEFGSFMNNLTEQVCNNIQWICSFQNYYFRQSTIIDEEWNAKCSSNNYWCVQKFNLHFLFIPVSFILAQEFGCYLLRIFANNFNFSCLSGSNAERLRTKSEWALKTLSRRIQELTCAGKCDFIMILDFKETFFLTFVATSAAVELWFNENEEPIPNNWQSTFRMPLLSFHIFVDAKIRRIV